jgi:hypothetical protein
MKKLCYELEAGLDVKGLYTINTVYCIKCTHQYLYYLLAILNSDLMTFYARNKYKRTSLRGGYIELRVFQVQNLKIKIPAVKDLDIVTNLAKEITKLERDDKRWGILSENINNIVYKIYGITIEEKKYIKEFLQRE